jgi:hypothetical protein
MHNQDIVSSRINPTRLEMIKVIVCLLFFSVATSCNGPGEKVAEEKQEVALSNKIALNAFSFNSLFKKGSINIFEMMDYCASLGFDGVDITGYYFPTYPDPHRMNIFTALKKEDLNFGWIYVEQVCEMIFAILILKFAIRPRN